MRKMFFTIIAGALLLAACDDSSTSANSTDMPQSSNTTVTSSNSNTSISSDSKTSLSNSSTTKSTGKCSNASDDLIDSRDGKIYKTVKIGDQIWMAENMNYASPNSWTNDSLDKEGAIYGRFYTFEEVNTVCPDGWHLPSSNEFGELLRYVGDADVYKDSSGTKLKTTSGWNWDDYDNHDGNGTDSYCFGAKPAGVGIVPNKVTRVGERTYFWTSTSFMGKKWDSFWNKEVETGMESSYLLIQYNTEWAKVDHWSASENGNIRCIKGYVEPKSSSSEDEFITVPAPLPDSVQKELDKAIRIERLNNQIAKLTNLSECETIESFTEDEIAYCKTRFCILHPELFECEEY
ncbi:FISUMP domain-containing protein [uncultured Fibrobacter sp.]|uniref:FISUMP domain-containing protein n=1 Tax=uncultured Fibrobacter sp. TaxID=261512 RepID=UPI0025F1D2B7|nr:FISUMP domain-containing protein [uncultured Fibrobacter sp.]